MTTPAQTDPAAELRAAAAVIRERAAAATKGPWREHDTHLDHGGHTATILTARDDLNHTELVAWLPSMSHEPWDEKRNVWANSMWIALMHPGVAEPLAALLEASAKAYLATVDDPECPNCGMEWGGAVTDCACIEPALAVARALLDAQ